MYICCRTIEWQQISDRQGGEKVCQESGCRWFFRQRHERHGETNEYSHTHLRKQRGAENPHIVWTVERSARFWGQYMEVWSYSRTIYLPKIRRQVFTMPTFLLPLCLYQYMWSVRGNGGVDGTSCVMKAKEVQRYVLHQKEFTDRKEVAKTLRSAVIRGSAEYLCPNQGPRAAAFFITI